MSLSSLLSYVYQIMLSVFCHSRVSGNDINTNNTSGKTSGITHRISESSPLKGGGSLLSSSVSTEDHPHPPSSSGPPDVDSGIGLGPWTDPKGKLFMHIHSPNSHLTDILLLR